jgi:hypothetical protein
MYAMTHKCSATLFVEAGAAADGASMPTCWHGNLTCESSPSNTRPPSWGLADSSVSLIDHQPVTDSPRRRTVVAHLPRPPTACPKRRPSSERGNRRTAWPQRSPAGRWASPSRNEEPSARLSLHSSRCWLSHQVLDFRGSRNTAAGTAFPGSVSRGQRLRLSDDPPVDKTTFRN